MILGIILVKISVYQVFYENIYEIFLYLLYIKEIKDIEF